MNLPIVVAGGAAGKVRGGRHIKYAEPTPLANLHLTLLDSVGVRLDSFAGQHGKDRHAAQVRLTWQAEEIDDASGS